MKIFGKTLSEYVSFEKAFLILILVVGLGRLTLSLAGVPDSAVKYLSVTVALLLGLVYYSIAVHARGFGSYKQLLPIFTIAVIVTNCIVVGGIVLSIYSGHDNIFSAPEYSPNKADGRTWAHARDHVVEIFILPLIMWGLGSLIMLITRKVTGGRKQVGAASA